MYTREGKRALGSPLPGTSVKLSDSTILDVTARAVVAMDRSNRVDYALQCERLKALAEQWRPKQIIAEQNSIGQPIIEQLGRDDGSE